MRMMIEIMISAAMLVFACSMLSADGFLKADGAKLMMDGKEYRAIGVNAPDLFSAYAGIGIAIGDPAESRKRSLDAVSDARKSGIAFIRFWATGFWPSDMKLYFEKPDEYWKCMDYVFDMCRRQNIKLVPSIFFNHIMWPMICGEDVHAIVNPKSKTYEAMHKYAGELVTRYKDDTNVLMWELTNEAMLAADVYQKDREAPNKDVYLPDAESVKKTWKSEDSLTRPMILSFYKEMAGYIKSIDPNHLVTSGDAHVRECSQSLRESYPAQEWKIDTMRQYVANLLSSQPEPLDVFSLHLYGSSTKSFEWKVADVPWIDYHRSLVRAVHSTLSPLFVGEFGQMEPGFSKDSETKYTIQLIDMFDSEGVALAALWAWHFPWQPENNVTSAGYPVLVNRIAEYNRKYAGTK